MCHGATGQGNGITSKYGLLGIANYHQDKYRQMADGQIFNTITHGFNTMMAYGDKVTVKDRWAIIAYIRALQKSQYARLEDVPENQRAALENEGKPQNAPQQLLQSNRQKRRQRKRDRSDEPRSFDRSHDLRFLRAETSTGSCWRSWESGLPAC